MPTLRNRYKGFTLLESIVVMGIMVVILAASHTFLASGVGFYLNSVQSIEVQQQALTGLTRIVDEMENSNFDAIIVEGSAIPPVSPPPASLASSVITFPHVFDINGDYSTTDAGKPLWQSVVCFMPFAMPDGSYVLQRKIEPIAPGVDYLPDPLSMTPPRNAAFFNGFPARNLIARNVVAMNAVRQTDTLQLTLIVNFNQRTQDSMQIESKVFPRN